MRSAKLMMTRSVGTPWISCVYVCMGWVGKRRRRHRRGTNHVRSYAPGSRGTRACGRRRRRRWPPRAPAVVVARLPWLAGCLFVGGVRFMGQSIHPLRHRHSISDAESSERLGSVVGFHATHQHDLPTHCRSIASPPAQCLLRNRLVASVRPNPSIWTHGVQPQCRQAVHSAPTDDAAREIL